VIEFEMWRGFPNEIFVFTSNRDFWKILQSLTGYRYFSIYYYPDGSLAWQASFPAKCRRKIEKLWSNFEKNRPVDNQQLSKPESVKSARGKAILRRDTCIIDNHQQKEETLIYE